ncbi:MAG: glycosyltransferase family 2 protein [Deltaproteobacteria bacterium]|nr:MAG: glycosyltransferase family 2 protein [Deltaproteobacteria bacterium]
MAPTRSDVCAVVVSWNTKALLRDGLAALTAPQDGQRLAVVCVDNGSTDGSVQLVEQEFPWVALVSNADNVGFAAACNQGIALAMERYGAGYVALVNSDVVVDASRILALVRRMSEAPRVAAVGPALRLPDGRLQTGAAGFAPTAWSGACQFLFLSALSGGRCRGFFIDQRRFAGRPEPVPVDWVSGACMVVRGEAIGRVGLLDGRFFMYGEDVEWCQRMRRDSWAVWYVPQVEVVHRQGSSGSGASPRWLASMCELVRRDRGRLEYLAFRGAAALGLTARRVAYGLAYVASRQERYRRLAADMRVYASWAIGRG